MPRIAKATAATCSNKPLKQVRAQLISSARPIVQTMVEQAAGVKVDLQVWDEMIHIWPYFADIIPEGKEAIARMGGYIREKVQ